MTANNVTYQNLALDRTRSTAPEVVKYSPVWKEGDADLACNVPVVIDLLTRDMDVESVEKNFSITPAVEGNNPLGRPAVSSRFRAETRL